MLALAAFAGAMLFYVTAFAPVAPVHLALASGAMPLIAGAMLHFVPVLTRSAARGRVMRVVPWLMLFAGVLVFTSFVFPLPTVIMRNAAATLGMIGSATLVWWIVRLSRGSLGRPHPGVYWYLAAMICLLLGLITVLLMHAWPTQYLALRRFHLHINTLGFIGITAIGTLQVLLPTALNMPDARAGKRLHTDLKWVLAGSLLIAIGAAWFRPLVWPGLLLWLAPLLRLGVAWLALYKNAPEKWNENATGLAGALLGFVVVLAFGAGHASGAIPAASAGMAYLFTFLLPLVTGAASYLLPLWLKPGPQTEWHMHARKSLARFSLLRVLLFISAGAIVTWNGSSLG